MNYKLKQSKSCVSLMMREEKGKEREKVMKKFTESMDVNGGEPNL